MATVEDTLDKLDDILDPAGLVYHESLSEVSGHETWTRWDDTKKIETIVSVESISDDGVEVSVEVGFYDEDSNRISSSVFGVNSETAWPFFENTLKEATA